MISSRHLECETCSTLTLMRFFSWRPLCILFTVTPTALLVTLKMTLVRHALLDLTGRLDVDVVTDLPHPGVGGEVDDTLLAERHRHHEARTRAVTIGVRHFDGDS